MRKPRSEFVQCSCQRIAEPSIRPARKYIRRGFGVVFATIIATLVSTTAVTTTRALLSDQSAMAQVSATAGTVQVPTGLTLVNRSTDVRVSWTAPGIGIIPQSYDVFRATAPGGYGGSPDAAPATSPWDDTSTVDCTTYYYQVRSRHTNLVSGFTGEASIVADPMAPSLADSAIVATSGLAPVADYVKPGAQFYAYATIGDNCTADANLDVDFDLSNLGASAIEPATAGSYTPVAGGPTYNFRAGPFTSGGGLSDGSVLSWAIARDDTNGNTSSTAGNSVTVDGVGPISTRTPQAVAASTDYYAPEVGHGEVQSGGNYQVYAEFSDAGSGVASQNSGVTADMTAIDTGATAINMPDGAFATDNAISWTRRSGTPSSNGGLGEGLYAFSVTALDRVGNTTTENSQVEIDDTGLSVTGCMASDGNNTLGANDTQVFSFDDAFDPGIVDPGWLGTSSVTFNARLRNAAANDYWQFAGINLLAGNGSPALGIDLGATTWTTSDWTTSQLARTSASQVTITYAGGSNSAVPSATATAHLRSTQRDAAGNVLTATAIACSSAY